MSPRVSKPSPPWREPPRLVIAMIALTTVLAAVVGILDSEAARRVDDATVNAEMLGAQALQAFLCGQNRAQVQLEWFEVAQEQRVLMSTMSQRMGDTPAAGKEVLLREWHRRMEQAQAIEANSEIKRRGIDSPERDPMFPAGFLTRTWHPRFVLEALQDAANEDTSAWKDRGNEYAVALTMFGLALFLFGHCLFLLLHLPTQEGWLYRLFIVIGLLLATGGSVVAGVAAKGVVFPFRPSGAAELEARQIIKNARADECFYQAVRAELDARSGTDSRFALAYAAAIRYADGMVEADLADAGSKEMSNARNSFEEAVSLRPTLARAYVDLADAIFAEQSPRPGDFSLTPDEQGLRASRDSLLKALRWLKNKEVLSDLGHRTLLLALVAGHGVDSGLLKDSERFARDALDRDRADPMLHYDLASILLAEGRPEEARQEYTQGTRSAFYGDVTPGENKTWTLSSNGLQAIGAALEILETLGARMNGGEDAIENVRESLVGMVYGKAEARKSTSGPDVTISPGELDWHVCLPRFDPARDKLVVEWYYQDPKNEHLGWSTLNDISGDWGTLVLRNGHGCWSAVSSNMLLLSPPRCFPPGKYRVELYVNGHLSGRRQVDTKADFSDLVGRVAPDHNMVMCLPRSWKRPPKLDTDLTIGFADGYAAGTKDRGAFFFRYQHPRGPSDQDLTEADRYVGRAIEYLRGPFLPRAPIDLRPTPAGKDCTSLRGAQMSWYRYENGRVLAGVKGAPNGTVKISLVFGPPSFFQTREACDIADSFLLLRERLGQ